MIDEEMLLGMAATYVARRGLSDEVGRAFGEWMCGEYEEAEGWEDLSPWATEWEAFCLSEDRSQATGERYVIDYLGAVALADRFSRS